jgi:hypothetical protein
MTQTHHTKLAKKMVNVMSPPRMLSMITGAIEARQDKSGTITLTYEDMTQEKVKTRKDLLADFDDFVAVVSFVQSQRTT